MRQARALRCLAAAVACFLAAEPASAHVKWFCSIVDVSSPPQPLARVISPLFVACGAGFVVLVFAGLVADGWVARRWPEMLSSGRRLRVPEELVVRAAVAAYCVGLWDRMAVVPWGHAGAILTPELLDHDRLVGGVQLAVAGLLLSRRTCGAAAVGVVVLYGLGVARYGVFHMTDYVYFLGFAAYLWLTPEGWGGWRRWRLPALGASLGFSLMWTAVEKFLYPQWTAQVLLAHPSLTAGLPVATVIVIAGFVEFSLAFYLVAGRGLLRLGAAALIVVFLSAIPEFGALDSVGHLPIVAILLAVILRGATPLQDSLRLRGQSVTTDALAVCGLFVATLGGMMAMYYGLQLSAARA